MSARDRQSSPATAEILEALESGSEHRFTGSPNPKIPAVAAGVYTVWRGAKLIYVGMSGRSQTAEDLERHRANGREHGLRKRLHAHAQGRRSGDQFCVYVADRLVLPTLSEDSISAIASGTCSMDDLVKQYVQANLTYRFITVRDHREATHLERQVQQGRLRAGAPLLNPAKKKPARG